MEVISLVMINIRSKWVITKLKLNLNSIVSKNRCIKTDMLKVGLLIQGKRVIIMLEEWIRQLRGPLKNLIKKTLLQDLTLVTIKTMLII